MKTLFALLAMTAFSFSSHAATLNIDGSGQLLGAYEVNVGDIFYDVVFQDGLCADVFSGCNESSDFAFNTFANANSAASALIQQVFINVPEGQFDNDYWLTAGCAPNGNMRCIIKTAYEVTAGSPTQITTVDAVNFATGSDLIGQSTINADTTNLSDSTQEVFAVWSARPPEPPQGIEFVIDNSTGKITGATGIIVNDGIYSVTFIDGDCVAVYGGCSEENAVAFSGLDAAAIAAQELGSQVLAHTNATLIRGCNTITCGGYFPYEVAVGVEQGVIAFPMGNSTYSASVFFSTASDGSATRVVWVQTGTLNNLNVPVMAAPFYVVCGFVLLFISLKGIKRKIRQEL